MYYKAACKAVNNNRPYHLAAIAWRHNTPVAIGINSIKTHPKAMRYYKNGSSACMHAEMHALFQCKGNCDKIEVLRVMSDGTFGMARPCKLCMEHIKSYGITDIRYTDANGEWQVM